MRGHVTCPAGHTVPITRARHAVVGSRCRDCTMPLHEHDAVLFAARRQAETPEFQTVYRQHRPTVERSIAWLTRGNRRLRHRVAAVNLRRLVSMGPDYTNATWVIPATT